MSFQVQVHTQDGDCINYLEQAYDVRYDAAINETPKVEFSLPADDPKSGIELGQEIWLFEATTLVDKFRILEIKAEHQLDRTYYKIEAAQIIDYLCDNLVPSQTWTGQTVSTIMTDLLGYQSRFTLGVIDAACNVTIADEFEADWESILELMKNLQEFCAGCLYVDPTAMTVNLREIQNIGEDKGQQLRYRKNIADLSRSMEKKSLITKLYALGGGEGAAKLTLAWLYWEKQGTTNSQDTSYGYITIDDYMCHDNWLSFGTALPSHVTVYKDDVGDTAVWYQGPYANRLACDIGDFSPSATYTVSFNHAQYLLASGSADIWGVVEGTTSVEAATSAEQLSDIAVVAMDECRVPRIVYSLDAVDLSYLGDAWAFEKLKLGSKVKVIDEEMDVDFADYIVSIKRRDLREPHRIKIDISNSPKNINKYLASAAKKRGISEKKATTRIPVTQLGVAGIAPSAPTNVTGAGIFAGIVISWSASPETDVQAYEIYRSATSTPPGSPIGQTSALIYSDMCGVDEDYYYWVKAVNFAGLKSPLSTTWGAPVNSTKVSGLNDIMSDSIVPILLKRTMRKWSTDLVLSPKSGDEHDSVSWDAKTIRFQDGTDTQSINANSFNNLSIGTHYAYFSTDASETPAELKETTDYTITRTDKHDLVAIMEVTNPAVCPDQEIAIIPIDAGGLNLSANFIASHAIQAGMLAATIALLTNIMVGNKNDDPLVHYPIEIIGSGDNKGIFFYDASDVLQISQYAHGDKKGTIEFGAGNGVLNKDGIELKSMAVARGIGFARYMYEGIQYYNTWDSLDGCYTDADGNGSITLTTDGRVALTTADDTADAESSILKQLAYQAGGAPSWDENFRFKTTLGTGASVLNFNAYVGIGYVAGTQRQVSFHIDDSPHGLYAAVANGASKTEESTGVTLAAWTTYVLEAIFYHDNKVEFYVNGDLKKTFTTNLPTGTMHANRVINAKNKSVGTYKRDVWIGPWYYLREP